MIDAALGVKYYAYFATMKELVDAMSRVLGFDFAPVSVDGHHLAGNL